MHSGIRKNKEILFLSRFGEKSCISRSQAKRVLRGLEKFDRIVLDFSDVSVVGQGFVDEVFRVFQNAHSDIELTHVHANDDIQFMINRSLA